VNGIEIKLSDRSFTLPELFPPSDSPFIKNKVDKCPICFSLLNDTGFKKLISPPLDIVQCEKCKLSYWRKS